jgi:hypothetical protein
MPSAHAKAQQRERLEGIKRGCAGEGGGRLPSGAIGGADQGQKKKKGLKVLLREAFKPL